MISQKQFLRDKFRKQKTSLPDETLAFRSGMICDRLTQTVFFQKAKCIALYCATGNEVQTCELIKKYQFEKTIVLPVIAGENMHFHLYTGKDNLKEGAFGIPEPVSCVMVPPDDIDLFIVPGVAFDHACHRLGRGKGYYDRYLVGINKPVIGLCFDHQLVESIPNEMHDKIMTLVLTETATLSQPY